jgi:hypothetical protein
VSAYKIGKMPTAYALVIDAHPGGIAMSIAVPTKTPPRQSSELASRSGRATLRSDTVRAQSARNIVDEFELG